MNKTDECENLKKENKFLQDQMESDLDTNQKEMQDLNLNLQ